MNSELAQAMTEAAQLGLACGISSDRIQLDIITATQGQWTDSSVKANDTASDLVRNALAKATNAELQQLREMVWAAECAPKVNGEIEAVELKLAELSQRKDQIYGKAIIENSVRNNRVPAGHVRE